ncbi:MAG: RluA family pseudouridine synthase [Deltaproteobacteria bacterium]|nr:RluA family pseudouridine synthase [Deltaproteobacteria bacterium]
MTHHTFLIEAKNVGERVDVFLSENLHPLSRSQAKKLIDEAKVLLKGKKIKPSYELRAGDVLEVEIPPPASSDVLPEELPLDILFEDEDIIVVNKSAGMVVHPGPGHQEGTLVNALLGHCKDLSGIGGELKPGIVHRLDKGTSGVMVAAKNDAAHLHLAAQFADRTIQKTYFAVVVGACKDLSGRIESSIGRSMSDRKKISSRTSKGRRALTEWRILERLGHSLSTLEIGLRTGRTHQIRVHMCEMGHPLVGDEVYGGRTRAKGIRDELLRDVILAFPRPALHSLKLRLLHPRTLESMLFTAPLAEDIEALLGRCREILK